MPLWLTFLENKIKEADGYVIVSGEYNESIPPALTNMMDHFPPRAYAFKPCAIVSYSASKFIRNDNHAYTNVSVTFSLPMKYYHQLKHFLWIYTVNYFYRIVYVRKWVLHFYQMNLEEEEYLIWWNHLSIIYIWLAFHTRWILEQWPMHWMSMGGRLELISFLKSRNLFLRWEHYNILTEVQKWSSLGSFFLVFQVSGKKTIICTNNLMVHDRLS